MLSNRLSQLVFWMFPDSYFLFLLQEMFLFLKHFLNSQVLELVLSWCFNVYQNIIVCGIGIEFYLDSLMLSSGSGTFRILRIHSWGHLSPPQDLRNLCGEAYWTNAQSSSWVGVRYKQAVTSRKTFKRVWSIHLPQKYVKECHTGPRGVGYLSGVRLGDFGFLFILFFFCFSDFSHEHGYVYDLGGCMLEKTNQESVSLWEYTTDLKWQRFAFWLSHEVTASHQFNSSHFEVWSCWFLTLCFAWFNFTLDHLL